MKRNSRLFQIGIGLFLMAVTFTNATRQNRTLSNVDDSSRIDHARELLGQKNYPSSPIVLTEGYSFVSLFILDEAQKALPNKYKNRAFGVAQAIISEANKHNLDPLFVLALIKQESRFNPEAVGSVGELGLMQIRPETAVWLSQKFDIKFRGAKTLRDPEVNILIGVQYVSYLREMFGHGRLYLSAYNMGPKKLKSNLARNYWPKEYSSGVMKKYLDLNKALAAKITIEKAVVTSIVALQD